MTSMNIYNHIQSKVYANDPSYDAFTGRVAYQHTVTGITLDGWKVRHTVEYIDLGRPDPVLPVDPDAQMAGESLSYEGERPHQRKRDERHAEMQMDVVRYLRQYGPSHMSAMATDLEVAKTTLDEFVRQREGRIFCRVGHAGRAVLWGLVGIHEAKGEL